MNAPILIVSADRRLTHEAHHVAVATGKPVLACDPFNDSRGLAGLIPHLERAHALIADAASLELLKQSGAKVPRACALVYLEASNAQPDWELAIKAGAQAVCLLPEDAEELLKLLGAPDESQPGLLIGVISAVGGAGTSTLAALLARQLAEFSPLLIDAHPAGGSLDLLLGLENSAGIRWSELNTLDLGAIDAKDLRESLPHTSDGIAVLTHLRGDQALNPATLAGGAVAGVGAVEVGAGWETVVATAAAAIRRDGCLGIVDFPSCWLAAPGALAGMLQRIPMDALIVAVPLDIRSIAATAGAVKNAIGATQGDAAKSASFVPGPVASPLSVPMAMVAMCRNWSEVTAVEAARLVGLDLIGELTFSRIIAMRAEESGLPPRLPRKTRHCTEAVVRWIEAA